MYIIIIICRAPNRDADTRGPPIKYIPFNGTLSNYIVVTVYCGRVRGFPSTAATPGIEYFRVLQSDKHTKRPSTRVRLR